MSGTDDWTDANDREEAYVALADALGSYDEAFRVLLDLFDADRDMVEEAASRLVLNGAGRLEGRIAFVEGQWEARPECGPRKGQPRRFDRRQFAEFWILDGRDPGEVYRQMREATS